MPVKPTDEQRENRAIFRLTREPDGLRTGQLFAIGVDWATINRLAEAGAIKVAPLGRWAVTNAGKVLYESRFFASRYSTCG